MRRDINIISGITGSGKSWLLERILALPQYKNAVQVKMDEIGRRFWGDRWITKTERVYRNELTRNEVKTLLLVQDAKTIFLEAPMLTKKLHQEPFVAMIRSAEEYLCAIEIERAEKEKRCPPEPTEIRLQVVLLYCAPEIATGRIEKRDRTHDTTGTNVFSFTGFLEAATQFELPEQKTYIPLPINTGTTPEMKIIEETMNFFSGLPLNDNQVRPRLYEAGKYLTYTKKQAQKFNITPGSV